MSRVQFQDPIGTAAVDYVLEAHGSNAIVVPDAQLLFTGTFKRVGPDLHIESEGRHALLPDYFAREHGATLLSPDGARLGPELVRSLAGQDSPWQVAQAGGSGPIEIGTVRSLSGTATVQRGGASQSLGSGEPVFQGDLIETGAGSSLGIILRDNTVFSLSAGARMVMNELVYDPARTDNSMAVNLVQGTFVFITGQVAKTGTIAVTTPVATMGIRGTTPIVQNLSLVNGYGEFSIAADPAQAGQAGQVGSYTLTLPSGLQTTVASPDVVVRISNAVSFDVVTKSATDLQSDQQIIAPAYQIHSLIGQRGDIPSPNEHANATGKGQSSGGFQYAFAVTNLKELAATQLLDNTVIERHDPFGDGTTPYQDVLLQQVIVGGPLGLDLDIATPGVNRQATFVENADGLPVATAPQIIIPTNATQLSGATIVLQNQLEGDSLEFGTLPPGITLTVTLQGNIILSGVASAADYIAAIQAIRVRQRQRQPLDRRTRRSMVTVMSIDGQTATATTFVTIERGERCGGVVIGYQEPDRGEHSGCDQHQRRLDDQ